MLTCSRYRAGARPSSTQAPGPSPRFTPQLTHWLAVALKHVKSGGATGSSGCPSKRRARGKTPAVAVAGASESGIRAAASQDTPFGPLPFGGSPAPLPPRGVGGEADCAAAQG